MATSRRLWIAVLPLLSGCVAAPHALLSAADSMDLLAASLKTTVDEYGSDLDSFDDERRKAVVNAFVARVRADHKSDEQLAAHASAFALAADRIEADRRTAWNRRAAALENLEAISEIADGLRRMALESTNTDEQARTYLAEMMTRAAHRTGGKPHDDQ